MKKQYIFAAISILMWSTVATITKLLMTEINNIQLLWASSLFACLFLLVVNISDKSIKILKEYKLKDILTSVVIGLPGTLFYYLFYYGGTYILPASQAFIINYLWPIMSVLFACIIVGEKLTIRKIIAILISFVGVVVVAGADLVSLNKGFLTGALLCVAGAVSYGIFTAFNQKYKYDKKISMMMNYAATFLITTVINAARGDLFIPDALQTMGIVWNGVFTMAIACTAWIIALSSGNTAKISNLAYITPFLSLVWTFFILGEEIALTSVAGLVIIVGGIFIQLKENKK